MGSVPGSFRLSVQSRSGLRFPLRGDFSGKGGLRLELKDEIKSPVYSWPRTLLTYPVDFSQAKVKPEQLTLQNQGTGKPELFQLSQVKKADDGTLVFADVSFISDLPSGADRVFVLGTGNAAPPPTALPETTQNGMIEVDGRTVKVQNPASMSVAPSEGYPSPIVGLNAGAGWCGGGQS